MVLQVTFYSSGQIFETYHMRHGVISGETVEYFENGGVHSIGEIEVDDEGYGFRFADVKEYYEGGSLK